MRALVIYDTTGRIWSIVYGEDDIPQGLLSMFVDIPEGARLESIDVTDPANPQPVFSYASESDIGRLMKDVEQIKEQAQESAIATATFNDEAMEYMLDLDARLCEVELGLV